jgi:hypothetical protein
MATAPAYTLERDDDSFVIRVNSNLVDESESPSFLDYLRFKSIRNRSQLTEEDAGMLANEVKQAAYERVRHIFERE